MMSSTPAQVQDAAFALFVARMAAAGLPFAAAEFEWERQPAVRAHWQHQVETVLAVLGLPAA